jgi:hypothetical protein
MAWLGGLRAGRPDPANAAYAIATIALSAFWSMIRADFAPGGPKARGSGAKNQEI